MLWVIARYCRRHGFLPKFLIVLLVAAVLIAAFLRAWHLHVGGHDYVLRDWLLMALALDAFIAGNSVINITGTRS